jgi:3-hydroxyisobutyrate dehydrogenase
MASRSKTPALPPVAFIGLGIMGHPMAGHLLSAGHPMTVYTRTKTKASELARRGATLVESAAEAARHAEVVFVCVTDTPDVQDVLLGDRGVIQSARKGLIVVDHSTISPAATREMAAKLHERGTILLDAPISGGDVGARNATLSIMVGGDKRAFTKVESLLKCMGKTIIHCGPSGAGQLTKLVNQILVGVTLMGVSEAMIFAKKNGLDPEKTLEAVGGGAAASWQLLNLAPKMIGGDFRPGFMINLMQKDLRLLMQAAEESSTSLPAASLVHQLFAAAQAAGHGKDGTQAMFTVLEKLAAVQ